jgi:hypothetical protein
LGVQWDARAEIISEVYSKWYGSVQSAQLGYALTPLYTGNHRTAALFIAHGPHFSAGQTIEGDTLSIWYQRFSSTSNVAQPAYRDGRIFSQLFARQLSFRTPLVHPPMNRMG